MIKSMSLKEFKNKLELIENIYGEENIVINSCVSDFIRANDNVIIDIENFNIKKYIKELEQAKEKTLQRLERINQKLENAKKIEKIKEIIDK